MKTKLSIFLTALAGGLISTMPAEAASFGNEGIIFDENTEVTFEFLQSHGWWQGSFGVVKLNTGEETILFEEDLNIDPGSGWADDNLGTPGIAVRSTIANFFFEGGEEYSLFLRSFNPDGSLPTSYNTQYSTTALNPNWYNAGTGFGNQGDGSFEIGAGPEDYDKNNFDSSLNAQVVDGQTRVVFKQDGADSTNIFFEDNTTWGDNDFDDFVVRATSDSFAGGVLSEPKSTPEPTTIAGLGMVAGAMFLSRSRKKQN
ncbi:MAG: PEP-CTERM sorting domain-containing protein [Okeania sp. SIO2F4]|uniref:PEP-CTERM sorting domain-containing protein n=1 Tax=Okeania sp. SIO2F4 TaxID=2607790 RepID=UPI00142A269F|nr:PEP-CTERM sorting domain-containing protein [Okeania sp. SIO2F4]NES06807.1 PEP-CTERM sorting domain-containing protein [Okeania sp. SIO2F4]